MENRVRAIVLFRIALNGRRPATNEELQADFAKHGIPLSEADRALATLVERGLLSSTPSGWQERPQVWERGALPRPTRASR